MQRSRKLAAAGLILGLLPPVLIGPLAFSYFQWILPRMPNYWPECSSFTCPPQQLVESLAAISVFGPELLSALAAMVCGYIGIKHWPRYPGEKLTLFNLSVALGLLWFLIFGGIFGACLALAGSTL
jgi:hypothetical protein